MLRMKESFTSRMRKAMDIRNMKQADLVEKTGLPKSAISQYYSGKYEPKQKGIYLIAKALNVNEAWLMGYNVPMERTSTKYPDNILKIETKKFPLLGTIAAGQPIFAEEQFETYVEAGANIQADFRTTANIYSHVLPKMQREANEKMNKVLKFKKPYIENEASHS